MRHDGGPPGTLGHFDRCQGLGQRTDLVQLDEDAVRSPKLDAPLKAIDVGDQQVIAHDLKPMAQTILHQDPGVPVIFVQSILNGDDGILVDPILVIVDHLLARQGTPLLLEHVLAILKDLAGSRVQGHKDIFPGLISCALHSLDDQLDRLFVGLECRGKAALVSHTGIVALGLEHLLERVIGLGSPAQRLCEGRRSHRHGHELLEVRAIGGMLPAVEDIHHGHW